jgi:hypothetical protein
MKNSCNNLYCYFFCRSDDRLLKNSRYSLSTSKKRIKNISEVQEGCFLSIFILYVERRQAWSQVGKKIVRQKNFHFDLKSTPCKSRPSLPGFFHFSKL